MYRSESEEVIASDDRGPFMVALQLQSNGTWVEIKELSAVNTYAQQTKESLTESLDPAVWNGVFYNGEHLRKRGTLEGIEEEL